MNVLSLQHSLALQLLGCAVCVFQEQAHTGNKVECRGADVLLYAVFLSCPTVFITFYQYKIAQSGGETLSSWRSKLLEEATALTVLRDVSTQ